MEFWILIRGIWDGQPGADLAVELARWGEGGAGHHFTEHDDRRASVGQEKTCSDHRHTTPHHTTNPTPYTILSYRQHIALGTRDLQEKERLGRQALTLWHLYFLNTQRMALSPFLDSRIHSRVYEKTEGGVEEW